MDNVPKKPHKNAMISQSENKSQTVIVSVCGIFVQWPILVGLLVDLASTTAILKALPVSEQRHAIRVLR